MIPSIPSQWNVQKQYMEGAMEICPDIRPGGVSTDILQVPCSTRIAAQASTSDCADASPNGLYIRHRADEGSNQAGHITMQDEHMNQDLSVPWLTAENICYHQAASQSCDRYHWLGHEYVPILDPGCADQSSLRDEGMLCQRGTSRVFCIALAMVAIFSLPCGRVI